ncbi:MAG: hypothetical protein ACD_30C00015G0003 [uncultured bacterium]|uniref:DNA repair protein RadA n=2 Tax=Candidatus Daviesiibacteriota TaxID=1752718 RepID=A0A1F5K5Y0_9BACT|nr:MAG: hypothetical protein ACD_30C00015G0003 [uncultured bacterium]KKQ14047.1 MAG: repair protein radA protein [Candidatus Daviesbacteria bacterium GW2011_GWA1_36_8]OGE36337.1 MAG: DNA repair protein RadA [Candidatus Daviesbacteria bacterium RIFCSPHIGHO2_12_FULL_37_16]
MAKQTSTYVCQQCGYVSPQFLGKCPECGTWSSLVEQITQTGSSFSNKLGKSISEPIKLSDIEKKAYDRVKSGIEEFDAVLGGGIVKGSVVLVAGDPGIGKSTLLSQLAINMSTDYSLQTTAKNKEAVVSSRKSVSSSVLYVAGEESPHQIKLRIERINPKSNFEILNETDVDAIIGTISSLKPSLVIVDSVQTLETGDLDSAPGSISQVRETAHRLQRLAKTLHIPIFLVGHVTKEGTVAGPRTLEHLVDVVLWLEGDPTNQFRILRSTKNRFGPTDEIGIFEMEESGMIEVKNPSRIFVEQKVNAPGSAVTVTVNGLRPLLIEIQALVTKTNSPIPRRVGTGVDSNRLMLLVAVLTKRLKLPLYDQDVFVNITGGLKITEPAADLAICMAILSSFKDLTLPPKSVFIGEVGLLGELRTVRNLEKRSSEAKKLGFNKVISSENAKTLDKALSLAIS